MAVHCICVHHHPECVPGSRIRLHRAACRLSMGQLENYCRSVPRSAWAQLSILVFTPSGRRTGLPEWLGKGTLANFNTAPKPECGSQSDEVALVRACLHSPLRPSPHPPSRQGVAAAPGRRHKAPEFMSAADLEPIGFDIGKDPVFGEQQAHAIPARRHARRGWLGAPGRGLTVPGIFPLSAPSMQTRLRSPPSTTRAMLVTTCTFACNK